MRVLQVTHQYRPAVGGAELAVTCLAEELARRGHRVTVLTSRSRDYLTWRDELPARELLDGVDVRRFHSWPRGPRTWRLLNTALDRYRRRRARVWEPLIFLGNGPLCPRLFRAVWQEAPLYDLLHINNLHYSHAALAYAAARRRGLPVVLTPHVHLDQPATYDVGYMWTVLRGSDHVIADTPAERAFLLEAGLSPQRVTTAGVGVRLERLPVRDRRACRRELGLPDNGFVLLFLGRQTEYKGLELLLGTVAALRAHLPRLCLLVVGPLTDHARALWQRYDGLPGLINLGPVPDATRLAALNACDCLALPSTGEAFGIVYLEAWAVGKPVIAARTPAAASLIDDRRDGFLVPPEDVVALAECVLRLAQNPSLGRAMGERGQQKARQRYTVSHITDIVEGVYRRVLRRRG